MFVIISGFLGPVGDGLYLGPLAQCLALSVVGHYCGRPRHRAQSSRQAHVGVFGTQPYFLGYP